MDSSAFEYMRSITNQLTAIPTNADFMYPLADVVSGYTDVIAHPMDLSCILRKIKERQYRSVREWYSDVMLMYDNCITFYSQSRELHVGSDLYVTLAKYNMKKFRELTPGLECASAADWYAMVQRAFDKLVHAAAQSPVPQGIDPMIRRVYDFAEPLVPLKAKEIAETVDSLNRLMDKEYIKKDVALILREMEPELKMDEDMVHVDADKLREDTLKALWVYLKAHEAQ